MQKTIILAYHDIDSKENPTEKTDLPTIETVVRLEEFETHMRYLSENGYSVLSVKEYCNKRKEKDFSDKNIVLTFDDGHISNHQYALPILHKYLFSATFFVITDYIGKSCYMGTKEIQELLDCNMEIGSHGLTHTYLTELNDNEIDFEIRESKEKLEDRCGVQIDVFAYPGGHQNRKIVKSVKLAGYHSAASCITGRNTLNTNPFLLRRIELRRGTSLKAFENAIRPRSILFFQCIDFIKLLIKKTFGLKIYELIRQKLYRFYPFKR